MKFNFWEWVLLVVLCIFGLAIIGCFIVPALIVMARDMWAFALA